MLKFPERETNAALSDADSDLSESFWEALIGNGPASTLDTASTNNAASSCCSEHGRVGRHVEVDGKDDLSAGPRTEESRRTEPQGIDEISLRIEQSNNLSCAPSNQLIASTSLSSFARGRSEDEEAASVQAKPSLLTPPSASNSWKPLDDSAGFTPRRRRRSFTADGYVGVRLNGWVTLGEDLWKQGETLGLDKFLPAWRGIGNVTGCLMGREESSNGISNPPQLPPTVPGSSLPKVEPPPPSILGINRLPAVVDKEHQGSTATRLLLTTTTGSTATQKEQQRGHAPRVAVINNPGSALALRLASTVRALQTGSPQLKNANNSTNVHILEEVNAKRSSMTDESYGTQLPLSRRQLSMESIQPLKRQLLEGRHEAVPRPVTRERQELVRSLLLLTAQAVASEDKVQFRYLSSRLQPHVNQRGQGWERAAFCLLQSLTLRHLGEGPAILRRRMPMSIKEMLDSCIWVFSDMPFCPFLAICTVGTMLPRLIGNPHVHLVNIGESFVPELSNFLRLLASSTLEPRLKSFRLTHVRAFPLCRPGRSEFETGLLPEVVASMVHRTAEDLGIDFSFQGIFLKEGGLSLLDRVQRSPEEALGVCFGLEMKFVSEELWDQSTGGSPLDKLKSCIRNLRPDVVSCVEDDVNASCQDFPSRFASWQDFMWDMYEAGDVCIGHKDVRLLHNFEDLYWRQICRSVVACEGQERRWRPRSGEQQEEIMRSCGQRQLPASKEVMSRVQKMLGSYPEGWAAIEERSGLTLFFRGTRMFRATAWESVEAINQPCGETIAV